MTVGTAGYRESRLPNEVRTYIRTYIHTYIHTYVHTYMYGKQSFEMLKLKTEKIIGCSSYIQHRQKTKITPSQKGQLGRMKNIQTDCATRGRCKNSHLSPILVSVRSTQQSVVRTVRILTLILLETKHLNYSQDHYCICTVHVIRSLNCQYEHMHNFNVTG